MTSTVQRCMDTHKWNVRGWINQFRRISVHLPFWLYHIPSPLDLDRNIILCEILPRRRTWSGEYSGFSPCKPQKIHLSLLPHWLLDMGWIWRWRRGRRKQFMLTYNLSSIFSPSSKNVSSLLQKQITLFLLPLFLCSLNIVSCSITPSNNNWSQHVVL